MKSVAFIIDTIPSHIYATTGLARSLKSRGYNVCYWGSRKNQALIGEQGFSYRVLDNIWSRYSDAIRLPASINLREITSYPGILIRKIIARRSMWRDLPSLLNRFETEINEALAQEEPEFVILDPFLLAYFPYFYRRGVKTVVLSTKPLAAPDPAVPPNNSFLPAAGGGWSGLAINWAWKKARLSNLIYESCLGLAHALSIYTYHEILRESARRTSFPLETQRVKRWIQPDLHFKCVWEWAIWTAETDLPRRFPLPQNIRYVGPCVDFARRESRYSHTRGPGVRYLIYVAVGTVRFRWKDNLGILRKVLSALGGLPGIEVVISTGDERATASLGTPPRNIRIFDFVPQLEILRMADLAITHAGAGTFRECIAMEVPMLAYPRNHDQMGNSARIVYHGTGLRGFRWWDRPATIRRKVLRILGDNTFRSNLVKLRNVVLTVQDELLDKALADLEKFRPDGSPN